MRISLHLTDDLQEHIKSAPLVWDLCYDFLDLTEAEFVEHHNLLLSQSLAVGFRVATTYDRIGWLSSQPF